MLVRPAQYLAVSRETLPAVDIQVFGALYIQPWLNILELESLPERLDSADPYHHEFLPTRNRDRWTSNLCGQKNLNLILCKEHK